jgi:CrcB protein
VNILAVFVGGGLGSLARYALGKWAISLGQQVIWGTLLANFLACLILGYLMLDAPQQTLGPNARLLLAVGFCGGFSTFSTFSFEAWTLIQAGKPMLAAIYIAASIVLGLGAMAVFLLR